VKSRLCVPACVRAYVRACVRACAYACHSVRCVRTQRAMAVSVAAGMDPRVAAKIAPPALAPAIIDPKPEWRIKLDHWMVNEGPKVRAQRV
jgi:hypothetical protein